MNHTKTYGTMKFFHIFLTSFSPLYPNTAEPSKTGPAVFTSTSQFTAKRSCLNSLLMRPDLFLQFKQKLISICVCLAMHFLTFFGQLLLSTILMLPIFILEVKKTGLNTRMVTFKYRHQMI